jgi:hypothetical protein
MIPLRASSTRRGSGGRARERLAAAALIFLAVAALHYDVIFLGRSLVHSNYTNPLDQRGLPQNYGVNLVPHTVWANRNLSLYANIRDPATSWWQWEPATQFLRQAIESREWPFWDPYLGGGTPAMANLLPAFFFPPFTAVAALGASVELRNAYFLFLLWGAGFCSYLFLRAHAIGFAAATAGGAMVVMSGGLNQNLGAIAGQAASCLPVALCATRWFLDRPGGRRAAALALVYGSIALASLPPLLIAIFGIVSIYAAVAIATADAGAPRTRAAAWWSAAVIVSLALVAAYFVPVAMLMRGMPQVTDYYEGAGLETLPLVRILQLLTPTLMGGVEVYVTAPFASDGYPAHIPYVGLACLAAAVFASPSGVKGRTLFYSSLAAAVLVLMKLFGVPPVQWIGHLPLLEHVHFAHYLGVTFSFLIAFLAAQGIDAILRSTSVAPRRALAASVLAMVAVVTLLAIAVAHDAFRQLGKGYWIRDWGILAMVAAAIVLAMFMARRRAGPRLAVVAIVTLGMFEGIYNDFTPKPRNWDIYAHTPPYLRLIRKEAPFGRILGFGMPVPNVNSAFRVFGLNSLMTFTPPRLYELYRRYTASPALAFLTAPQQIPPDPVLDRANLQFFGLYTVVPSDVKRAEDRGFAKRYDDGFIAVYERRGDPRFLFSSDYRVVATADALAAIGTAAPRQVIVETPPVVPRAPNRPDDPEVTVDRYGLNHVRLIVDAPRPGLLYASETFFDGWSATVNGATARILPANYAFRAVEVGPGRTIVEFRYWPPGLTAGLAISFAAALAALVMASFPAGVRSARRGTADAVAMTS